MTDQRCPNCGAAIPEEVGQHALVPSAGIVECPTCGATVTLEKAGGETGAEEGADLPRTEGDEQSFAGEETLEGVMDEVREKEEG